MRAIVTSYLIKLQPVKLLTFHVSRLTFHETHYSPFTTRLVIHHLLLNSNRYLAPLILLVTQLWLKTSFTNRVLYGLVSKAVRSTGSTYHVLFNHDRAKVIGTAVQTDLCGLL